MKYHLTRLTVVLALLLLAGCGDKTPSSTGPEQAQNNATQPENNDDQKPGAPQVEAKVELKATTVAELKQAIEKHKGKVVLIDVWGTT